MAARYIRFGASLLASVVVFSAMVSGCRDAGPSNTPPGYSQGDTSVRPADQMTMLYVPGGAFRMGRTWSLDARAHGRAR